MTTSTPRRICDIAAEIHRIWTKPHFGAVPYLSAMRSLGRPTDSYGCDDAKSIVLYFLSNASTWRGEDARRIKKELKDLIK